MIVVLAKESAEEFLEMMEKELDEIEERQKKSALKKIKYETLSFMRGMLNDFSDDCKTEEQFGTFAKDFGEFLTKEREKLDL